MTTPEITRACERHRHMRLANWQYVWHEHEHTCGDEDFNNLHHHAPAEHDNFVFDADGAVLAGPLEHEVARG